MPSSRKSVRLISIGAVVIAVGLGSTIFMTRCTPEARQARLLEQADEYFEHEEYDRARIEYLNLVRENKAHSHALQRIGEIWVQQGAPYQALPYFRESLAVNDDPECRMEIANALFTMGHFQPARTEALAVLAEDADREDAILLLTNTSFSKAELAEAAVRVEQLAGTNLATYPLCKAILASRSGDLDAAEASLTETLRIDPKLVPAYQALAGVFQGRNERDKQRNALEKAAGYSSVRSLARISHARFLAQTGELDAARKRMLAIKKKAPDYLPAQTLLAEIAMNEKMFAQALAILKEVFARDSRNLDAQALKARIHLAQGNFEMAADILENLDAIYGAPWVKYNLARIYLRDGDTNRAGVMLERALAANPDYHDATVLSAELDLRTGEANAAAASLEKLLAKSPDVVEAQVLLARAYQAQGQLDQAAAIFRAQIQKDSGSAAPHFMLGMVLLRQKKVDEARTSFTRAQELAPDDQAITFVLVEMDIEAGDFAAAHARVRQQIERNRDWGAYFLQGKVYAAESKWNEAEASLMKALELKPDSVTVYNLLVNHYVDSGMVPEAIQHLTNFLETKPKSFRHRIILARLHEEQGRFREAAREYEQVLVDNPEFIPALNNLAYLYSGPIEKLERAHQLAASARKLAPEEASIADTLGWVLYKKGDYRRALALIEEAAGKLPENAEIHYHLGMALSMMGRESAALQALARAVDSEVEFAGKEAARTRLASLSKNASTEGRTVEELQEILRKQPNDLVSRLRLARLYEKSGWPDKAKAEFEESLKKNPDHVDALTGLARLYLGPLDDLAKAAAVAKKAHQLAPGDAHVLAVRGRLAFREGNHSHAYALLRDAVRSLENEPVLLTDLAWSAYYLGKPAEAEASMRKVAKSMPKTSETRAAEMFLEMAGANGLGDWEKMEPDVEEKLKSDPDYVPALMARAGLLTSRDYQADLAARIYEGILKRLPEFAPAKKKLAGILMHQPGKLDDALSLATKARVSLPGDPEVAQTLGAISYLQGDADYAVLLLKESANQTPLNPEGLYYLGRSLLETGKIPEGRKMLTKAVEEGLSGRLMDEAETALSR